MRAQSRTLLALTVLVTALPACSKSRSNRNRPPPRANALYGNPGVIGHPGVPEEFGYGVDTGETVVVQEDVVTRRRRTNVSPIVERVVDGPVEESSGEVIVRNDAPAADVAVESEGPLVTDIPTGEAPSCLRSWGSDAAAWAPGLPTPPAAEPNATGGRAREFRFTDAAADPLMDAAKAEIRGRGEKGKRDLRIFADRFDDVRVYTIGQGSTVSFMYRHPGQAETRVELSGPLGRAGGRREVQLRARDGQPFRGHLTCVDVGGGCQNALVRLEMLGRSGAPIAFATVVHRVGPARVTISERDQFAFTEIRQPAHRAFAEYLSNTANNSCLAALHAHQQKTLKLAFCELNSLIKVCGNGAKPRLPGARAFRLRTWAVAFGRAGFEFAADDKETIGERERINFASSRFVIAGPLSFRPGSPDRPRSAAPRALTVAGELGLTRADLINNDGAGNLNLQLDFGPRSYTRVSVSAMFAPVEAPAAPLERSFEK